ncbi:MAG: LacI family DNA-binding transcriptional regulator [Pseudomonadota bacterium]
MSPAPKNVKHVRPGLRQIAEATGLAVVTVHRVFNSPERVADKTKEKVFAAADRLGYVPDKNAAAMTGKPTGFLGVMLPTLALANFAATLEGVSSEARGRQILIAETYSDPETELNVLTEMIGRRPDGLILGAALDHPRSRKLLEQSAIPVVRIWENPSEPEDMVAGFDNVEAGAQAARHFLSMGYEQTAFFGGRSDRDVSRFKGFHAALVNAGAPAPQQVILEDAIEPPLEDYDVGWIFFDDQARRRTPARAVFATSDATAAAILFEAQRRNINVPERLAICGFGDLKIAKSVFPALTTIEAPSRQMGAFAAILVDQRCAGVRPKTLVKLFPTEIIARESG